jgi:protein O-mannosyl-transferase
MAAKQKQKPAATAAPNATRRAAPADQPPATTRFFGVGFWRQHWLPALLLVVASFGLYQQSMQYGYVLDDEIVIWKNKYVQEGFSGIGRIFGADSFMGYFQKKEDLYRLEGGRYRPLSLATFAAEISLWGKDKSEVKSPAGPADNNQGNQDQGRGVPWASHFINILLYGLTGVLLYRILLGLFAGDSDRRWWQTVAFFGAMLFVFHPLHVECVANIKGRDELLALLGSLGALYAMMRYFDTRRAAWQWASAGLFLLGLFAKENTLTFLAVIPLTIWWFGRSRSGDRSPSVGQAVGASWPLMVATLVFIIVRFRALGYMVDHGKAVSDLMNDSFYGMSFSEKTATIFLTLGWYIKLLLVPYPLTHDYYPYHVPKVGWSDWRAIVSLLGYAAAGIWAVWSARRGQRSVVAYAVLFFILTLSIVSNLFVSVGTFMNERFAYMPSVAFCMVVGWFLAEKIPALIRNEPGQTNLLGSVVLLPILGIFGAIIIGRIPAWETGFTLNESAVRNSPNSARAQSFYTTSVFQERYQLAKDPVEKARWVDTMEIHIKRALEINPVYGSAWVMRANIAGARFDLDRQMDKLFNEFSYCLEKAPYVNMLRGNVLSYIDYLAKNGGNPNKINVFAYRIGYEFYFQKLNDPKSGIEFMEAGLKTELADERLYQALADLYTRTNQPDKAARVRALPLE